MKFNGKKQGGAAAAGLSSGAQASPCAACKLLRRKCAAGDCVFAPHFPPDDPSKFANVHKVFGASNVNKMLQEVPEQQRADAVSSMVYEANARVRDPVYGCVGAISCLQQQIDTLQTQLAIAQAQVLHLRVHVAATAGQALRASSCGSPMTSKITMNQQIKPSSNMSMIGDQGTLGDMTWSC